MLRRHCSFNSIWLQCKFSVNGFLFQNTKMRHIILSEVSVSKRKTDVLVAEIIYGDTVEFLDEKHGYRRDYVAFDKNGKFSACNERILAMGMVDKWVLKKFSSSLDLAFEVLTDAVSIEGFINQLGPDNSGLKLRIDKDGIRIAELSGILGVGGSFAEAMCELAIYWRQYVAPKAQ